MSYKTIYKSLLSSWMFLLFLPVSVNGQFTGSNQIMDNGLLRFGTGAGTSQNSINGSGNLEQPWFYDEGSNIWKG